MYMYYIVAIGVWFAALAMTVREGLWNNLLMFCYLMLSGVITLGFYQPATIWLDEQLGGEYTYVLDIVVYWAIFVICVSLFKVLGVAISDTKVKFLHPIEKYLGILAALFCASTMTNIALLSLHLAPLPKDTMGGALVHDVSDGPTQSSDTAWLAVGALGSQPAGLGSSAELDPSAWVEDYANRRERFEVVMEASKAAWELKVTRSGG